MNNAHKIDPSLLPVQTVNRNRAEKRKGTTNKVSPDAAFGSVFREEVSGLKFSAHAQERLETRKIDLTLNTLERLRTAVERASSKGSQDSLVLIDDKAFVVSVKNKTVITALAGNNVKEGVFTKIDSAVVV